MSDVPLRIHVHPGSHWSVSVGAGSTEGHQGAGGAVVQW